MKRIAVMVHGMWVRDGGRSSVGQLEKYLEETHHRVKQFKYPFIGLIGTRTKNDDYARRLEQYLRCLALTRGDSVTLYCHSNGCTIAHLTMGLYSMRKFQEAGVEINVVYINAALERKIKFPSHIKAIRIFYTTDDKVVVLSHYLRTFLKWFGLESRWRPWGDMGCYGYSGPSDRRVRSSSLRSSLTGFKGKIGHLGGFKLHACKRDIAYSVHNTRRPII